MKNIFKIITVAIISIAFFSGQDNQSGNGKKTANEQSKDGLVYDKYCPMPPEVINDIAGVCPKYSMDLEVKK